MELKFEMVAENGTYMSVVYSFYGWDSSNDDFAFFNKENVKLLRNHGVRDAFMDSIKSSTKFASFGNDMGAGCSIAWSGTAGW